MNLDLVFKTPNYVPEKAAWLGMIDRCHNPNNKNYSRWGGRGIRVCDRWRNSYDDFLFDVGARPSLEHSIDRFPNNDGNYEPGNVRWATRIEQGRNQSTNKLVNFNGKSQCYSAWEDELGFPDGLLKERFKYGWSIERALTTKPRGYLRLHFEGRSVNHPRLKSEACERQSSQDCPGEIKSG